ncbi:RDD family protein [Actinacidiphila yeochonensis]|uniref:RDD family protein n=1 Tax=Actinacidiphila yeochonensis TaxID=89050 RepID=UPI0006914F51|nr:RDD family protein [Actinacidiphila yeochonensis]
MPPLASWGARVGATLLDSLILFLVPGGLYMAGYLRLVIHLGNRYQDCSDQGISHAACPVPQAQGSSIALILIGGLLSLVATFYVCYREGKTGQSPGKRIVGIRLLREYDGRTLGFGLAFGRRLLHFLDGAACYLGYLWPLWDSRNQTFADKIVHTVVIKDPQ